MTLEDRISALERENAKLKAKLQRVGLMPKPVDLPTDNQVDRLIAIVTEAHPKLKPAENETAYRQHFINSLHYLTFAFRADNFSQYATTVHLDECSTWLQKFDLVGGTSMKAFVAAAIAQRFNHSKTDDYPYGIELAIGLGASAHPVMAWRTTLRDGRVPPPVESKKHVTPVVQQLNLVPGMRSGRW
jgi:hypothetical protein